MANTQKVMTLADTAKLIAKVHANAAKGVRFEYDGTKGEYGNIAAYFAAHKDGKVYGVRFPKYTYSNTPTGVKTRDNANLTIEISTNAKAGRDDYAALPAFRVWDVNATVDDDGVPHVTAIDGLDNRFKRDGTNGDVYVMTCPGYYKLESTSTHNEFLYSDTQYDGYTPMPGVLLPDGSKRPCLLFAKYAASLDSQQRPLSVSGKEIDREFGSQNRAIDYALKKGKGYAGRCAGDTFYVQLMLMLKYATKTRTCSAAAGSTRLRPPSPRPKPASSASSSPPATPTTSTSAAPSTSAPTRNATTPATTAPPGHAPS